MVEGKSFLTNCAWRIDKLKKIKVEHYFKSCTIVNSKYTKNLHIKKRIYIRPDI